MLDYSVSVFICTNDINLENFKPANEDTELSKCEFKQSVFLRKKKFPF